MKNHLTLLLGVFIFGYGFAQDTRFWKKNRNPIQNKNISTTARNTEISQQNTYDLRVDKFKEVLSKCPKRFSSFGPSNVIITLPAKDGKFKKYRVKETNVLHPDLAKKFPDIKSYVGTSINEDNEVVYFSMGHNNFKAIVMKPDATLEYIQPYIDSSKT